MHEQTDFIEQLQMAIGGAFTLVARNLRWLLLAVVISLALGFAASILGDSIGGDIGRSINSLSGIQQSLRGIDDLRELERSLDTTDLSRTLNSLGVTAARGAGYGLLIGIVSLFFSFLGLVIYSRSHAENKEASIIGAFKQSSQRLLPGIFTAILFFLIIIPTSLVIVGIYLAIAWIFCFVITLNEKKSGFNSFAASKDLVDGRWWKTFGFLVIVGIITLVVNTIVTGILGSDVPGNHVGAAIAVGIGGIFSQYQAAFLIVMYHMWKGEKALETTK